MQNKYSLQPIRITSNWTVVINNFYEVDPSQETVEWFYGNPLLSCSNDYLGRSVEVIFEPTGDPNGDYVIQLFSYTKKGKAVNYSEGTLVKEVLTKNRIEAVSVIETLMLER